MSRLDLSRTPSVAREGKKLDNFREFPSNAHSLDHRFRLKMNDAILVTIGRLRAAKASPTTIER
jgi:hypothetical protein